MVAKPVALWHSKVAARVLCPVCRLTLLGCGCSSGVEHNLAKVGVEGSNPFARSNFQSSFIAPRWVSLRLTHRTHADAAPNPAYAALLRTRGFGRSIESSAFILPSAS